MTEHARRSLRARIGWRLRCVADRIDPDNAPRAMGWSFTFEHGKGIQFREDRKGCPLWYLGHADSDRAYTESDSRPPWIDWATMSLKPYSDEQVTGHD